MNKKCGLCSWFSDKCKNPDNPNYNTFRYYRDSEHKDSRCSGFKIPAHNKEYTGTKVPKITKEEE